MGIISIQDSMNNNFKINFGKLKKEVREMTTMKQRKNKKFNEIVELQLNLNFLRIAKNIKIKLISKLPKSPRKLINCCFLTDDQLKIHFSEISTTEIKKMHKNKKIVKKFANSFDLFLAKENIIKKLPRVLGPGLNTVGKFPSIIGVKEKV